MMGCVYGPCGALLHHWPIPAALAMSPLQGSASFSSQIQSQTLPPSVHAYFPASGLILKADRLAGQYKLGAAKALYQQAIRQNPRAAGGWNGLGKIAYYQTSASNQHVRNQKEALQDEAIQHFLTALRYEPGYVDAHLHLARIYMDKGRMQEAGEAVGKASLLAPNHYRVLTGQGEWLVRQGQYNEAVPYLERSIQRYSADDAAHYFLAVAYTAQNRLDEALAQLNSTVWLNPAHAPAHYQLGLIYEKQGNGAAAVEHYQQALALKPELTKARERLAGYLESRGDIAAALSHWKRLQESNSPDWEATERLGRLSVQNQQPEVAIALYRAWLGQHPEDQAKVGQALSVAKTALARQKLRDDDLISQGEAKRYAEQALQYQPNNFEARLISARLDREMGAELSPDKAKAPELIEVALREPGRQPYQSFEKGTLLLARFQFQEAQSALREARRTGEGNRNDMVFGELFLTMGLPDLAEESFQLVLKSLPDNAAARLGLSRAAQAKRQSQMGVAEARDWTSAQTRPLAIEKLKQALTHNQCNAEAHYRLAEAYEKSDLDALAADHYYAYLGLAPLGEKSGSAQSRMNRLKRKMVQNRNR